MRYRYIALPTLLVTLIIVSFIPAVVSAQTYTCKLQRIRGTPGAECKTDKSCPAGFVPKEECSNFGPSTCEDSKGKECIRKEPSTSDLGTAGCYWEWNNFLKQSGKCKTKFDCGTDATPKADLTSPKCEEIQNQGECEDPSRGVQACVAGERATKDEPSTKDEDKDGALGGDFQIKNPLQAGTIPEILNAIASFLYALALAVVTVMVLWGGFQILTAAGNPAQIDKGKQTLLWAVIGTVVILVAGGIADLTANILGGGE